MTIHPGLSRLLRIDGKSALVTGGGGGIGRAVCELLAEAGAEVHSADVEGAGSCETANDIVCDVKDPGQVAEAVRTVVERSGRLDFVVHCAGILRDRVLWKMSDAEWREVLAVNLDGAFYLLRAAAPQLREHGGAAVLISSINGLRGKFGQANYAASKAGLVGLAKTAARELGKFGARVNVIAPGYVETPMTAALDPELVEQARSEIVLGRLGAPEDIANAVLYLLSPMAAFVTGHVLRVDGGQWMG